MDLTQFRALAWEGRNRTYAIHAPENPGGAERAAVIVLHGGGTNAENAARMSGFSRKANSENFIAVYPNGTGGFRPDAVLTWNAGHCCGWAKENAVDDVGFLGELIDELVRSHGADPARVYMTGFSNGAMMAQRFAVERPDKVAAIAPVAGTIPFGDSRLSRPVPVLMMHGTEDEYAPFGGGTGAKTAYPRVDIAAHDAAIFWAENNGCLALAEVSEGPGFARETWSGGREDSEVILYSVLGQGHAWPGGIHGLRNGNVDTPSDKLAATDLIWEFFKKHTRKDAHARR